MSDFNALKFVADNAGLNIFKALEKAYEQGKADAAKEALIDKDIDVPNKWIPVSEKLPEEGHDVLITKKSFKIKGYEQNVIKAKRSVDPRSGKIEWWSEFGALKDKEVLAWMPLPEPYKEGE